MSRTRRASARMLLAGVMVLTGCAQARSRLPFIGHPAAAPPSASDYQRNPHRQYFDKLHKRYFYYDPDKKAYFWENGEPKR